MLKIRSDREIDHRNQNMTHNSTAKSGPVVSYNPKQNRMHPTLLSGISSRTQIDAKGKVKHLFEIT